MDCQNLKKLIVEFIDKKLQPKENQAVREHLKDCPNCRKELRLYEESWEMLSLLKDEDPDPGYISRFWTRLSTEQSQKERISANIRNAFQMPKWAPALATFSLVVIVGLLSLRNFLQVRETNVALSAMNPEQFEIVENYELIQNFDLIENIDLMEDLEIIENLDSFESNLKGSMVTILT